MQHLIASLTLRSWTAWPALGSLALHWTGSFPTLRVRVGSKSFKLNGNKTKVLLIGSKSTLTKAHCGSSTVRSLGIVLDSTLSFARPIQVTTQTVFSTNVMTPDSAGHWPNLELKSWSTLPFFPPQPMTVMPSSLDSPTNLSTDCRLSRAQLPETSSALNQLTTITPVFIQLHWLPVKYCIQARTSSSPTEVSTILAPCYHLLPLWISLICSLLLPIIIISSFLTSPPRRIYWICNA